MPVAWLGTTVVIPLWFLVCTIGLEPSRRVRRGSPEDMMRLPALVGGAEGGGTHTELVEPEKEVKEEADR